MTKYINIAEKIREAGVQEEDAGDRRCVLNIVSESLFFFCECALLKNCAHEAQRIEPSFVNLNFKD